MRILYVSGISPFPSNNGGRQRTKLILEGLREMADVDFVLHSSWPVDEDTLATLRSDFNLADYHLTPDPIGTIFEAIVDAKPTLSYRWAREYASRRSYYSEATEAASHINALCDQNQYDFIVVRYLRCACRSGLLHRSPLVIDIDDVDSDFFSSAVESRQVGWMKALIYSWQARQLSRLMPRWLANTKRAWISKADDAAKIDAPHPWVLPNAVDTNHPAAEQPVANTSTDMLFVGALHWGPNQLGLRWFVEDVLPLITRQIPTAKLRVVGSACPVEFSQWLADHPNVVYVGEVADVGPYYRTSAFSVVPVHSGAGSHIKVPESLYQGITCVCTPYGHRGYEEKIPNGKGLLVGATAEEMATHCIDLLRSPIKRSVLAAFGLNVTKANYTKAAFMRGIRQSLLD